ncbi:MAG: oligosaccharide flippase family protein [Candidatus Hydrogenedens sp.]|nr:oligosaccharide flippase family protein [Candidatus Hydrogenedens sp.]
MSNTLHIRKSGVLEGAFWSWLSTVVNLLALLIVGKLFAISLNKEEVAVFSLLLVWSDGFVLFFGYGLQVSIPKLIGGASDETKGYLSETILTFSIINAIIISLITFLIWGLLMWSPLRSSISNSSLLFSYFWVVPLLFVVGLLRDILLSNLSGFQVFGKRALGVTIASILQVLFSVMVLVVMQGKIISLSFAYIISYLLTVILLWFSLPTQHIFHLDTQHITSAIKFSWILWINSILNYLVQRFDTVILLYLTGSPAQVALYEMAKRLTHIVSRMLNSLLLPYLPRISELLAGNQQREAEQFFTQAQNAIAILSFVGIMCFPFVQKIVILVLFSREYLQMDTILIPLLAGIVIAVLTGISGQTLIGSNRPYIVTITNIGTVAINLGLNFLLIPRFGMIGSAWSALISFLFSYLAQTIWVKRTCIHFEWHRILIPQLVFAVFLISNSFFKMPIWSNSLFILVSIIITYYFQLIPFEYLYRRLKSLVGLKT